MDVRQELSYEASPAEVFEMLCDEGFREQVCKAIGSLSYDVSVSHSGDTTEVRVRRVLPAEVPDFAKKFVGDKIEMVQIENWGAPGADGRRRARFRVEIPGKPGSISGDVTVSPAGSGTQEVVAGEVKVSIPLVGRKLEGEVARGFTAALKAEQQVGRRWLADRG